MFFGLGSHFQAKRAYLSQIRVFGTNGATAMVSGKAFSGKASLSEPDRVFFFGLARHFRQNEPI